ncbi:MULTISPECIES: hypothetical protein [Bradyrhizobium]|jgi:hypothetical protein|uniref:Uncharacterized protein n=2 Tax=Bradyrhizobium TaxID=374 RepID=A0ABY0PKU2_9BRAD|nr:MULTISPECIES: hypothetical protein [Bradyrhizobium]SDI45229.1 hypothetical protein SAMN05444163_2843 [Bradyrhizobium ottawaense]SED51732.1 hypothetical protein SAMN05444171_4325 [Bradyrhizobium lablabi]SHL51112.1 hypothetical protein SAMN05444321_3127 [Bradyrhizobium lablabi]
MPEASRSGPVVPYGADETAYVVVDSLGAGRETEFERADLEAVIRDLLSGQFNCPIRIVAFNTLEHWTADVSRDVAAEIQSQSDMDGLPVPEHLRDFVDRYAGSTPRRDPLQTLAGDASHDRSASG